MTAHTQITSLTSIPFDSPSIFDVNLNVCPRIFNPLELLLINLLPRIIVTEKEFAARHFKGQSMTKIKTKDNLAKTEKVTLLPNAMQTSGAQQLKITFEIGLAQKATKLG